MSTNTKNLGLVKPAAEDFYNVDDFNLNFQRIDDFVGGRGYYIGNVDELKTPGTYVVATFSEGMSGTYPLPTGRWYTVIVSLGGTGSIIQDWILATEPNVPMRKFTRHFDANYWSSYFESVNTQNPVFPKDITLQKAENGKTVIGKNHSESADYGTEIVDYDADGNKTKFTVKSNDGLENAVGFSMNDSAYYRLYGEHNAPTPPIESEEYPGCYYRMYNGVVEWINPPMVADTEYKLTKRFKGKPVYAYLVNIAAFPNNSTTNIQVSVSGSVIEDVVDLTVVCGSKSKTTQKFPMFKATDDHSLFGNAYISGSAARTFVVATYSDLSSYSGYLYAEYTKA